MATLCSKQLFLQLKGPSPKVQYSSTSLVSHLFLSESNNHCSGLVTCEFSSSHHHKMMMMTMAIPRASPSSSSITPASDDNEGVSLGTMKLPMNTDLNRFESLLFQWGNSLCQGAQLPLPVPLKVDKIQGGIRLGFVTIGDGATEVLVYIDCLVFPAADGSAPIFRAIRDGPLKEKSPPGEPRIMKSLLAALQKSVEIARI